MSARTLLVIASLVLATACGGSRRTAADLIQRGDEQAAAGHYGAAAIEYRNAIRKEPARADAHRKLADTYLEQRKLEEAYRAYANAIQLDNNDVHSRVEAGRLLFGAGKYSEALLRAEQALERDDRNTDAQLLAGRALAKLRRFDDAIAQLDETVSAGHAPAAYAALAEAKLAAGDARGAEDAFRAAVSTHPESVEARIALARFLADTARKSDAEQEFLRAVNADPASEMANRAAASFYVTTGRDAAAEPFLKTAAGLPKQTMKSSLALADYYSAAHRYADARAVLAPLTAGASATPAKVRLAAIELESGSAATARRLLDEAMKRRPDADALTVNAQLLLREGKADEALAAARAAIDLDPRIAAAYFVAGTIALDRGQLGDAERAFREVLRQNRLTAEANLQLARTLLAARRPHEAVDLAAAAGPSADARLTLARALIADGQTARARTELVRLSADEGTTTDASILLGGLELTAGALPQARSYAERALAAAPDAPEALALAARTAIASHDNAAAERYLTHAIAVDPAGFEAHAMLAHTYASSGDVARARSTLEQFADRNPNDAAPRTALGIVLEAAGRPADARVRYEQALALDPGDAVASNNLARIYATDDARIGQAVELARNAAARMPNDADVRDTLGWVAFRAGRLNLAASELERAVALNGSEPMYRNHLEAVRQAIAEEEAAAKKAAAVKVARSLQ
jgi:tetratricopeptide (TPR) repeat protein